MQIEELRRFLDAPAEASKRLAPWRVVDTGRAHANLVAMATAGLTLDLLANVCDQLDEYLPRCSDPEMALNNLDRFVAASRNPLALGSLFERDPEALPTLVQIFSTSQYLSDLLVMDTASFDLLRMTDGQPISRQTLADELVAEVMALADEPSVMTALRRFKQRETLRIGYGDIIREQSLETVTTQISNVAEAILEAALRFARSRLEEKRGIPRGPDGNRARFVILALGKLGGAELNYSSDIDLVFLYDADGQTDGARSITNIEFFDRLARDLLKLLTEDTELGDAYRVDLRLRPEGQLAPLVSSLESALHYYDVLGRTWERQAFVKARAVAGDLALAAEFLAQLEPWVYRRYLILADITGIKALKRRIEERARREGAEVRNVKTGRGGIRDIEFAIQFLQLLNGGDLPEVRTGNTLLGVARLENVGCLSGAERTLLDENYRFLRKIEHRLQIMFDLQTHRLPEARDELEKLAIRLGYSSTHAGNARDTFQTDYQRRTSLNRRILDHLLHDAFGDDAETEPEVDLVLDPEPSEEKIREVLSRYRFNDISQAYKNLMALSTERIRFLSARRCRHFLASIAPRLLRAIAATPDPDSTLVNLENVSDSLGGKGVLWELFNFNPPTLHLYVNLCASSPFLSGILTSNPGMIDELMDSLVLNKLPVLADLRAMLAELCRAAEDLNPILHSFKSSQHLRVGVRDILGKEDIQSITGALADIAQACLAELIEREYRTLIARLGQPTVGEGPREGEPCELVVLGMGKLGGRELNYHSDLDVVFLYEADGQTVQTTRSRRTATTTNQHFFSELGQRIMKLSTQLGPYGRLYEMDARLRPTGRSGILATSLDELVRYFATDEGQLWERQALCKARAVYGAFAAVGRAMEAVADAAYGHEWSSANAEEIIRVRRRLEDASRPGNLKRGSGGLVDVEFIVQMLQLKHAGSTPSLRDPNTLSALEVLHAAARLTGDDYQRLSESYRFLRTCEARLQLLNTTARHELPDEKAELDKLASLLHYPDHQALLADFERHTHANRECFERIVRAEMG